MGPVLGQAHLVLFALTIALAENAETSAGDRDLDIGADLFRLTDQRLRPWCYRLGLGVAALVEV
jgi:hypothetical protein